MAGDPHPAVRREIHDDPPPFLGTWKRVYLAVALYLVALILIFAWISRTYAP